MKKLLMMMVLAACASVTLADRPLLSYLSFGPDKYADGASLLEGEWYALVFVKAGQTFAGFNADGSLVDPANGQILNMGPWAEAWAKEGVGCPPHNFQPEEGTDYGDGSLHLYVLDTRAAGGKVLSGVVTDAAGAVRPVAINGYGEASSVKYAMQNVMPVSGANAVASSESAVPPSVGRPTITGIEVKDGYAYLTVEGTAACVQYDVTTGSDPSRMAQADAAVAPVAGDEKKPIVLKVKLSEAGNMFKIGRHGLKGAK